MSSVDFIYGILSTVEIYFWFHFDQTFIMSWVEWNAWVLVSHSHWRKSILFWVREDMRDIIRYWMFFLKGISGFKNFLIFGKFLFWNFVQINLTPSILWILGNWERFILLSYLPLGCIWNGYLQIIIPTWDHLPWIIRSKLALILLRKCATKPKLRIMQTLPCLWIYLLTHYHLIIRWI